MDSPRTPTVELSETWKAVEDALAARPYPGLDDPGGWGIQLYGYPSNQPYGPDPEDRYHAMAAPTIDSHHRNMVRATGPTPVEALQRLLARLQSTDPSLSPEVGERSGEGET